MGSATVTWPAAGNRFCSEACRVDAREHARVQRRQVTMTMGGRDLAYVRAMERAGGSVA